MSENKSKQSNESNKESSALNQASLTKLIKQRGPAPVHLWNPPYCGTMDMRIASDGTWYHLGDPVRRQSLVRLFSAILKREGDEFFLVTPGEKIGIKVDDCPFVATTLEVVGEAESQAMQFTLNTGDTVTADADHAIIVTHNPVSAEPHPIIHVRDGLNALLARNVFYHLVDMSQQQQFEGAQRCVVRSKQCLFELGRIPS